MTPERPAHIGRIGILGGSFNPVHNGHLRLALEARELLGLARVDLLPCACPPHKPAAGLLPFELRVRLLRAAVEDMPFMRVNAMEGERPGPSYTWDSLARYAGEEPEARRCFLLGCEDFAALPSWHRGVELPELADFVIAPRDGAEQEYFARAVRGFLPCAKPCAPALFSGPPLPADALCFCMPQGTMLIYLPLTRLDISASDIRRRFLSGRSARFLLPDAALRFLEEERETVARYWAGEGRL